MALACACSARPGSEWAPSNEEGRGVGGSAAAEGGVGDASTDTVGTGGPSAGSPVAPSGPPAPPRELSEVDSGYPLVAPTRGTCPAGTAPSERFTCTDVPFCRCEYVCSPACGEGEVCMPASDAAGPATCACHAALEPSEGGCVWRGLLADPGFDDVAAWRLHAQSSSEGASAEVRDGTLELRVSQRCSYAWGGAVARLPADTELPGGAALVFEYRAVGAASDDGFGIQARLNGVGTSPLDPSGRSALLRSCVSLDVYPRLALLEFEVQALGTCAERVELGLSIDNVRLEAEPSCGPR
jgi:hypothetical protein